jgi:transposase
MERIYKALTKLKMNGRHTPGSSMGQAIDYALDQWSRLCLYLGDGRLEIDNNLVENAIRCTALGKKNWLFFGEADAGEQAAIIYTVLESCRRRGLDPYAYLCDVLSRLPKMTNQQTHEVTPAAWAKAQLRARQRAA